MKTIALLLSLAVPASAQARRIGAAGAVSGAVTAAGASDRVLKSGSDIFYKDAVTTDAKGRLQVMLLDQTVFTVGPNSKIVLDEFVYNPFTDAGEVTARVTRGVFRFVSGKVAAKRPADMKIKIPSGTIGIRGTFGAGSVDENGDTLVALLGPGPSNNGDERVGGLDIDTGKDTQSLDEPGTGVTVKSDGDVSEPFTLTPEQTAQLNAGGTDSSGGTGGSGQSASAAGASSDESASESAGQDTAVGGQNSSQAGDAGQTAADLGEDTSTAAQASAAGGIKDGIALWDDVRTIPSGQAHYYVSSAPWDLTTCNNGTCANNSSGSMSFQMNIDFGNRTVGGNGSAASFSDSDTNATGPVSGSISIPVTGFGDLNGNASLTFVNGSAMSVDVSLMNANGNAADFANATANFSQGGDVGSGTAKGLKFDGLIPQ